MASHHTKALNEIILEHLEHLGLAEAFLAPLRVELAKKKERAEGSMLFQLYLYAAEGMLDLALFNLSGSRVRFSLNVGTTVRELKSLYSEKTEVPVREQQLIYRGKTLDDCDVLAAQNVSPFESHITVVRVRPPKIYVLGGLADDLGLASVEVLDTADHSWETLPAMTTSRGGSFGAAVMDNQLYVVGGTNTQDENLASGEVFNPIVGFWTPISPMMTPRHNFVSAVVGRKLYVIGGDDGQEALAASEVYNPAAACWEWMPPMPTPRFYAQSAVIGDKIYIVGGDDGATAFSCLEAFDTLSNTWESLPNMSTPRFGFRVVVADGKLYAIGGYDGQESLSSTEVYDPLTRRWESILPMWCVRSRSASAVLDNKVYTLGGYIADESIAEASGEMYDSEIGAWIPLPFMNTPRFDSTSVVVGRRLYMFGGDNCEGIGATASAEYFDADSAAWTQLPEMREARRSAAVVILDT